MEIRASYVGKTIEMENVYVGYGMTGLACKREGITDDTNFIFKVDVSEGEQKVHGLLPATDLYFDSTNI